MTSTRSTNSGDQPFSDAWMNEFASAMAAAGKISRTSPASAAMNRRYTGRYARNNAINADGSNVDVAHAAAASP